MAGLLPARVHLSDYDDETRRDVELIAEILSRLSPERRRRMAKELVHEAGVRVICLGGEVAEVKIV